MHCAPSFQHTFRLTGETVAAKVSLDLLKDHRVLKFPMAPRAVFFHFPKRLPVSTFRA